MRNRLRRAVYPTNQPHYSMNQMIMKKDQRLEGEQSDYEDTIALDDEPSNYEEEPITLEDEPSADPSDYEEEPTDLDDESLEYEEEQIGSGMN